MSALSLGSCKGCQGIETHNELLWHPAQKSSGVGRGMIGNCSHEVYLKLSAILTFDVSNLSGFRMEFRVTKNAGTVYSCRRTHRG